MKFFATHLEDLESEAFTMTTEREAPATTGANRGEAGKACRQATPKAVAGQLDVFGEARERYDIPTLWGMLRLPGDPPTPGRKFSSPFRPDRHPSCDISKCGRWFADRSQGLNLDAVAFVRHALDCDWTEVRRWFKERLELDYHGGKAAPRPASPPRVEEIEWPSELLTGTIDTWAAFAKRRKLSFPGVAVAVQAGVLRFLKVRGVRCYAVTDPSGRTGEIRRCNGTAFENGRKAYPLRGPDKSWPVGAGLFPDKGKAASVLLCEGATDYLAAFSAYCVYRKSDPFTVAHVDSAPEGAVYIGRANPRRKLPASQFKNPFKIGPDGDRDEVLAKYRQHLADHPELVQRAAVELDGKTVSCWCHPERCHGDELAEAVKGLRRSWLPLGLLGANCRKLHPELVPWFRGRTVRIVPDGDPAGRDMADAWRDLLRGELGCTVEIVGMPDGRDLRDMLESGELEPGELFA